MIARLIILLTVIVVAGLAWLLLRRRALARARSGPMLPEIDQALRRAQAAILYFSTTSCVQCRTQQAPALSELQRELGPAVEVVSVDATAHPALTSRLGIMTVPATVVFDRQGVRAVNLGYASASRLRQQLS